MLTRPQFLHCLKIDDDLLKSFTRRDQLPFPTKQRQRGEYRVLDGIALSLLLRQSGNPDGNGASLKLAGTRLRAAYPTLVGVRQRIAATSFGRRVTRHQDEIFLALICLEQGVSLASSPTIGGWQSVAGTREEINEELEHVPVLDDVRMNVSVHAFLLRQRAWGYSPPFDLDFAEVD